MVRMWDRAGLWLGGHRTAATGKKVKTPGWGGAGLGGTQAAAGTRHTPVCTIVCTLSRSQGGTGDMGQLGRGVIGVTIIAEADTKIHPVAIVST